MINFDDYFIPPVNDYTCAWRFIESLMYELDKSFVRRDKSCGKSQCLTCPMG